MNTNFKILCHVWTKWRFSLKFSCTFCDRSYHASLPHTNAILGYTLQSFLLLVCHALLLVVYGLPKLLNHYWELLQIIGPLLRTTTNYRTIIERATTNYHSHWFLPKRTKKGVLGFVQLNICLKKGYHRSAYQTKVFQQ
jgi:hypothetical protein